VETNREIVNSLDSEFTGLIDSLKELVRAVGPDLLYRHPPDVSLGEQILRSAAVMEQTFGGLTANLWDDPFEWTLPETLSTSELIVEYLSEVDSTRQRAFNSIATDSALSTYVSVPSGERQRLVGLLLQTLLKAGDYRGRAVATLKILSGEGAAGFII
jgi:hypothetical protein